MSPLVSALLGVTTARYSVQVYMYLAQTLVYLTVSLCMIDTTARLLVRCPLDPSARNVFFFLFEPGTSDTVHTTIQKQDVSHLGLFHIACMLDSHGRHYIALATFQTF